MTQQLTLAHRRIGADQPPLFILTVAGYRDVRYTVPFLIQFWLFATPIAYPSSLLPHPWQIIYGVNPMAGVVEGFRWALLGSNAGPGPMVAVSAAAALALLFSGAWYFRRMEQTFADLV